MISQNPSTKALSSNDTRKLGLNGALKNTLPRLKYIQEMFGKVNIFKQ